MTDPYTSSFESWTANTSLKLSPYGILETVGPVDWKRWANRAINLPTIRDYYPPKPDPFSTWQEWAAKFNLTLANLGL